MRGAERSQKGSLPTRAGWEQLLDHGMGLLVMNQTRLKIQSSLCKAFIDPRGKGGIWNCPWIRCGYPGICPGWVPCSCTEHTSTFLPLQAEFSCFPSDFQRQKRVLCPPFLEKTLVRNGADWGPSRLLCAGQGVLKTTNPGLSPPSQTSPLSKLFSHQNLPRKLLPTVWKNEDFQEQLRRRVN